MAVSTTGSTADNGILIVSARDIATLSSQIPLSSILTNQADVFRSFSRPRLAPTESSQASPNDTSARCPHRTGIEARYHTLLFMPACNDNGVTSIKCVSVPKPTIVLPPRIAGGIPGTTLLFHPASSRVRAVVNASELTALRTAAGSVVATVLALPPVSERGRTVRNVALFGGGIQALYHAWLLCRVYEGISIVTFVLTRGKEPSSSTMETIERLRTVLGGRGVEVRWSDAIEDVVRQVVRQADIVCCCTPSDKPLLQAEWVKDGTHFNIVGAYKPHMVELPAPLVQAAASAGTLLVDSIAACEKEAGDLIQAGVEASQMIELGSIVPDNIDDWTTVSASPTAWKDRQGKDGTTPAISIFKSVGIGLQDVAVTAMFVDEAENRGLGQTVDFF